MAILIPAGLDITAAEPVDSRLVLTKAEMLKMKKGQMPDMYYCLCKDDGNFYIYNKTNDVDPEVGRFRVLANSIGSLAKIAKTGNVNDLIQSEGDVLILDCNNAS